MKITLRELARKYNQNFYRMLRWVYYGWLPAKKEKVLVAKRARNGKVVRQKMKVWVVEEQDYLDIPTFIRKKRNKK